MKKLAATILILSLAAPMHAAKPVGKHQMEQRKPSANYILKNLLKKYHFSIPRLFHSVPQSVEDCGPTHKPNSRWTPATC